MPYQIRKKAGRYQIIRRRDGKVVGTSDSLEKARASIAFRMQGERKHTKRRPLRRYP